MTTPLIDLSHEGTDPLQWQGLVRTLRPWRLDSTTHRRVVVVAPHPDDETLGAGGVIAEAGRRGIPVVVVSVTDGEACSGEVGGNARRILGDTRHAELRAAVRCLAPRSTVLVVRCGLPDGGLSDASSEIGEVLTSTVRAGDLILAPLPCDGHPDHDAVGDAVIAAFGHRGDVSVALFPVWAWHWHDTSDSVLARHGRRVDLSPAATHARSRALACYSSQIGDDDAVLPEHFLRRFDVPWDVVVPLPADSSLELGLDPALVRTIRQTSP